MQRCTCAALRAGRPQHLCLAFRHAHLCLGHPAPLTPFTAYQRLRHIPEPHQFPRGTGLCIIYYDQLTPCMYIDFIVTEGGASTPREERRRDRLALRRGPRTDEAEDAYIDHNSEACCAVFSGVVSQQSAHSAQRSYVPWAENCTRSQPQTTTWEYSRDCPRSMIRNEAEEIKSNLIAKAQEDQLTSAEPGRVVCRGRIRHATMLIIGAEVGRGRSRLRRSSKSRIARPEGEEFAAGSLIRLDLASACLSLDPTSDPGSGR